MTVLSDLSLWGIAVVLLLLGGVLAFFYVLDRKSMTQLLRVLLYFCLSMLVVALYMWGLEIFHQWWIHLLWIVIASTILSSLILRRSRLWNRSLLVPVHLSVFLGTISAVGIGLLLLPVHQTLLIPALVGIQAAFMLNTVSEGLKTYIHSMRHTQSHYQYLLANGASHLEAILPSVRRSMRAVLVVNMRMMTTPIAITPPMLLCGLLVAGVSPVLAVIIVCLLILSFMGTGMLTMLLMIILSDRFVFDRSGRFLL